MATSNIANAAPFFTCPSGDIIDLAVTTSASCPTITPTATSTPTSSHAENEQRIVSDQQTRQVFRQISSYINSRIERDINPEFFGPSMAVTRGASADGNSLLPDSLWSAFSWSRLSNDVKANGDFDANIYQTTTGVDKKFGNFYIGTTLNYAGTSVDINPNTVGGMVGSNHNVGLTPYAAYIINKNFFVSALTGYMYSNSSYRGAAPGSEMDAYQSEVDLNGLHVIDQWFMKGKAGARYIHSHTKTDPVIAGGEIVRDNQDSWTYLAEVEGGYAFKNGLRAFTGVLYEYNDSSEQNLNGVINVAGKSTFYYSAGADYSVSNKLSLGAKVQTDLNNHYVDLTTVTLTARLWFD
ncbi:autotransporter outer membrane beta-barrel domain-containing protein [Methylomonas sp. LL1]|nr:autotransporter outer membrane beta-barrel domain-containing protein [Methylomonas sp. LL1]